MLYLVDIGIIWICPSLSFDRRTVFPLIFYVYRTPGQIMRKVSVILLQGRIIWKITTMTIIIIMEMMKDIQYDLPREKRQELRESVRGY